ncbi:unnamed protein product [Lampetra planeri]
MPSPERQLTLHHHHQHQFQPPPQPPPQLLAKAASKEIRVASHIRHRVEGRRGVEAMSLPRRSSERRLDASSGRPFRGGCGFTLSMFASFRAPRGIDSGGERSSWRTRVLFGGHWKEGGDLEECDFCEMIASESLPFARDASRRSLYRREHEAACGRTQRRFHGRAPSSAHVVHLSARRPLPSSTDGARHPRAAWVGRAGGAALSSAVGEGRAVAAAAAAAPLPRPAGPVERRGSGPWPSAFPAGGAAAGRGEPEGFACRRAGQPAPSRLALLGDQTRCSGRAPGASECAAFIRRAFVGGEQL